MDTRRVTRVAVVLAVALIGLALLGMITGPAAAAGEDGAARRAALGGGGGPTPNDIAGPDDDLVVAFTEPGTVGPNCFDGTTIHYGVGDALFYAPAFDCWAPWISLTNSGLPAAADINALHDECGPTEPRCDVFFSLTTARNVPGVGRVSPQDVVGGFWRPGTLDEYEDFWLAFDGSDVGLTTGSERIDAMFLFDENQPAGFEDCIELGWFSTAGDYKVRDQWGGWLTGGGEDVLGFCASSIGAKTAGYWFLYHDGSAEGLPKNALNGLSHEEGKKAVGRFNFLTNGPFWADAANGDAGDVFEFSTYNGSTYRGPLIDFWDDLGVAGTADSFHVYHRD